MKLTQPLADVYCKEQKTALEAQRLAQEISFAPMVFQVSRLMVKFGILEYLSNNHKGVTQAEIVEHTKLSNYAVQVLLEASLSIGTVITSDDKFFISKAGGFLLNDPMAKANMNFNHDVNYLGLFHLEDALIEGKPSGLKVFGEWPTIYEGLSSLPAEVQKSWFGFDHFYSDESFAAALKIIFDGEKKVRRLLDVGGNTGRWAMQCVGYNKDVEVTIMDETKPYHIADSFSFILNPFYANENVNKYWNRDNLLCSLEVGKDYLLMVDDDSYTMEDPTHKAELVFIMDADFPYDSENYHSIISYIGYIEGGYTGYRKDYTGFR